ncbi:MAG: hypothetical protein FJ388_21465, partial [Verrucomicrobia bacterium]|nr:hypothetical protein [Verrucomicrobiota bacterium]
MRPLEAKRAEGKPQLNHCLMDNGVWVKNTGNLTDMLGAEAARYIAATKDAPWFLYCAFNAPHGPHQTDPVRDPKFAHITDDAQRKLTTTIVALDDAVGVIIRALRDSGQIGRTLVVFASDNGVSSVGEWGGGKGTMLEGGLRVPLFLSWPGKLPASARRDDRVSFLDLAPTILAAVGVNVTPAMKLDGTNLLPALTQNQPVPTRAFAWRMDTGYAFRDEGDWKLVGSETRQFLYNLKDDPRERTDLATKHPDKLAELSARWKKWDADNARPMWRSVSEGAKKPTGAENRKKREDAKKKSAPTSSISSFKDAAVVWHMGGADTLKLTPSGNATLGVELSGEDHAVSLKRGGDGRAAKLDGGWLVVGKEGSDPMGDTFDGSTYTMLVRVKTAGDTLHGTFFSRWAGRDHMPVDFSAWRMPWGHLSTRGIGFRTSFKRDYAAGQDAVLDFYCPVKEPLTGWQDIVVRLSPQSGGAGVLDLFVNGAWFFRNAEERPGGLPFEFFLNETPGAIIGAEPGGRWPFRG